MILVAGLAADPVIELMRARLADRSLDHRFADLSALQRGMHVEYRIDRDGSVGGLIRLGRESLPLREVRAAFVRFVEYRSSELAAEHPGLSHAEVELVKGERQASMVRLFDHLPGLVVNRPRHSNSNHSKLFQQGVIRRTGLRTPRTLVTTDPSAARRFLREHGPVIVKSLSGIRSKVRVVKPDDARLDLIRNCPTQLQEEIRGTDIRVHVVEDRVFAVAIESDATDYRYALEAGASFSARTVSLPETVRASMRSLGRQLDLTLTGIDLKLTASGEYYCFEVNPAPAFLMYERLSGEAISSAVADALARADGGPVSQEQGGGNARST